MSRGTRLIGLLSNPCLPTLFITFSVDSVQLITVTLCVLSPSSGSLPGGVSLWLRSLTSNLVFLRLTQTKIFTSVHNISLMLSVLDFFRWSIRQQRIFDPVSINVLQLEAQGARRDVEICFRSHQGWLQCRDRTNQGRLI